jgi:hypothetical protein
MRRSSKAVVCVILSANVETHLKDNGESEIAQVIDNTLHTVGPGKPVAGTL